MYCFQEKIKNQKKTNALNNRSEKKTNKEINIDG